MGACRALGSRGRAQLGFQGVYRIPPGGGGPQLLVDRLLFDQPNGLCFSPDEKLLYVNDTVQTLIRVFDVAADGSLSNGRIFASGIRSSLEAGRARRHEMRPARQCLGDRARGGVGLCALGRSHRQGARPRKGRQSRLGRAGFSNPVPDRDPLGLSHRDQGRAAARAIYERASAGRRHRVLGRRDASGRCFAADPRERPDARPQALRAHHSGHAERRHQRRRRLRRVRGAGARARAERGREHAPPRRKPRAPEASS